MGHGISPVFLWMSVQDEQFMPKSEVFQEQVRTEVQGSGGETEHENQSVDNADEVFEGTLKTRVP